MTLRDAWWEYGRDAKLRRPHWPNGHWVWWHTADDCLYRQNGPLYAFGRLTADDQIADDWELVYGEPAEEP